MNVSDSLDQSHLRVMQVLDNLPDESWDVPGVCGDWSVKDVIAHLASYEHLIIDALKTFSGSQPTPYLSRFINDRAAFNNAEVAARKYETAQHVEDEYQEAQLESSGLLAQFPAEVLKESGRMPWSGNNQSLADFIAMMCEHSDEHCAPITHFREKNDKHI